MKKLSTVIALIFSVTFFLSNNANAEEQLLRKITGTEIYASKTNNETFNKKLTGLYDKLNLTEEQQEKARKTALYASKKLNIYLTEFKKAKRTLVSMKKSGESKEKINAQLRLLKSLKSRINITKDKNIKKFEEILTVEQKTVFAKFRDEMKEAAKDANFAERRPRKVRTRKEATEELNSFK